MVDAIGALSSQQVKPTKKDDSINWKQCTSDEIIEHEKEGQEIPDYILQWAKEFAKLQNAPEDVTYEMAMGATTMAGVDANQNGNKDSKTDDEGTNSAEAIRQKLTQDGVSNYDQAKTFKTYSDQYTNEIQGLMDSMEEYLAQSAAAADEAAEAKDDVMSRIQALIASKKQTRTGDLSSAVEAARIDREIRTVGQSGLSIIENAAAPIESTEANLTAAEFTSLTGRQFGNTAVTVGTELKAEGSYLPTGIGKLIMGRTTVQSGENEIKKSNQGDNQFSDNHDENNEYNKSILANKDEVRRASGASLGNTEDTEDSEKKADEDKTVNDSDNDQIAKESDIKKEELASQDPDTIDEKVTTDPNEILKRKQKRGLA